MNLINSDYFITFRYKFGNVIYIIEQTCILKETVCQGEKTKQRKSEKEERQRHPVPMYKCVCLTFRFRNIPLYNSTYMTVLFTVLTS